MIVKMRKVFVASSAAQKDRLLTVLRDLGVLHVTPVDPAAAVADDKTVHELDSLGRAIQILSGVEPRGEAPDETPRRAAGEVLDIHRRAIESRNRLTTLHRHIEQLDMWGDVRREQIEQLAEAGIEPKFYSIPLADFGQVRAEVVQPIHALPGKRILLAVVRRNGDEIELPESAEEFEFPTRDRPTIRAEATGIDKKLHEDIQRLHALANLVPAMKTEHTRLYDKAQYTIARRGGVNDEAVFAIQGWVPVDEAESLVLHLADEGVAAAVHQLEPGEDEEPPTLIRYPVWATPIQALFKILGTTPGYREYDLAPFFMLAMPIFTAMLVGDAGYGLLFILVGLLFGKKLTAATGSKTGAQLVLVFGAATLIWGVLTANYFGVGPVQMARIGGFAAAVGEGMKSLGLLWRGNEEAARDIVMKISFLLACIHLVLAHLRQAIGLLPHPKGLAEVGWCFFLVGMFAVVWMLFFEKKPVPDGAWFLPYPLILPKTIMYGLLIAGGVLVVLFSFPSRNPVKMIGLGLVANLMPMISTFSDTMSYIRLMAVGLASYYIASAFNGLAVQVAQKGHFLIFAGVLILLAAHALNIILCLIAIFAHGVRLNMLEFSNNAGVQWAGYPYRPFTMQSVASEGEQ